MASLGATIPARLTSTSYLVSHGRIEQIPTASRANGSGLGNVNSRTFVECLRPAVDCIQARMVPHEEAEAA
jgi:hypothetical protein